jgi:phosphoribosyl 1,2-cyclic phosphate phosphodiesterase
VSIKITFLGTGTSQGVPIINCDCEVCKSLNPKNNRMRCSVMVETQNRHFLIDTSMDMRNQFLRFPFSKIDAVLFTHAHADHIFGLDELRRFNYRQQAVIPVFGKADTIKHIKTIFGYAFTEGNFKKGIPNISANLIDKVMEVCNVKVTPIPLMHGRDEILGFRIGNFAYCTDVNKIPSSSYDLLKNLDVFVLAALRERPHPKHFSLSEAVNEAQKVKAKKTFFTHISHVLNHETHGKNLPANCSFAYDGMVVECS